MLREQKDGVFQTIFWILGFPGDFRGLGGSRRLQGRAAIRIASQDIVFHQKIDGAAGKKRFYHKNLFCDYKKRFGISWGSLKFKKC